MFDVFVNSCEKFSFKNIQNALLHNKGWMFIENQVF